MDEQAVFFYELNGERRAADPFRVERLLAAALKGEPLADVIRAARAPAPALAGPANEKLLRASCEAFGLLPLAPDGSGCTERTQMRVLCDFLRWRASVKEKNGSAPTSPPATGSAPSPSPPSSNTRSG